MSKNKATTKWKNIIVVDDNKKEMFKFEVGEKFQINDQSKPRKNVSTFFKSLFLGKDGNNKPFFPKKPTLQMTQNITIFSRELMQSQQLPAMINFNESETQTEDLRTFEDSMDLDGFTIMDKEQADLLFTPEFEKVNKYFLF